MKWFKHDSDAFLSEGVDALIVNEGFAGYGRWNRLLEIIAFKMDKTNRCYAEYSIPKWCSLLGLKQKKLISFLELTENKLKTKVVYSGNIIKIEIPNLLKKRDNYTKDLQETCKKLPSIEVEVEVDIDKDKEKKEDKKEKKEDKKERKTSSRTPVSYEEFILTLKNNSAYQGIDIDKELARMDAWFLTPKGLGRKKTHKFILNWLNKAEKELPKGEPSNAPYLDPVTRHNMERLKRRYGKDVFKKEEGK